MVDPRRVLLLESPQSQWFGLKRQKALAERYGWAEWCRFTCKSSWRRTAQAVARQAHLRGASVSVCMLVVFVANWAICNSAFDRLSLCLKTVCQRLEYVAANPTEGIRGLIQQWDGQSVWSACVSRSYTQSLACPPRGVLGCGFVWKLLRAADAHQWRVQRHRCAGGVQNNGLRFPLRD